MSDYAAINRLYQHNPKVYIILVLRNPVGRAYSAYWYARQIGWENIVSFNDAVWMPPDRSTDPVAKRSIAYLDRGIYALHIKRILDIFPPEQVLILRFEDLKSNLK